MNMENPENKIPENKIPGRSPYGQDIRFMAPQYLLPTVTFLKVCDITPENHSM